MSGLLERIGRRRADRQEHQEWHSADVRPQPNHRARLRRRARYLRQLREVQLRDLGGFMVEQYRFSRRRPDLVLAKLERVAATDAELRALDEALDGGRSMRELREEGIGGACGHCGSMHGSRDHFCANCGERL